MGFWLKPVGPKGFRRSQMPSPSPGRFVLIAITVLLAFVATADAAPKGPLSHEGRWITDKKGRVVILHGWNMVYKVGSYRPEDTGFGPNDMRFLKRHGFNTIRLGIIQNGVEPELPSFLARTARPTTATATSTRSRVPSASSPTTASSPCSTYIRTCTTSASRVRASQTGPSSARPRPSLPNRRTASR